MFLKYYISFQLIMSKIDLKYELSELSVNLKWASSLVEQLKKSLNDKNSSIIQTLLKEVKSQKVNVNSFCTKIDHTLNETNQKSPSAFEECIDTNELNKRNSSGKGVNPPSATDQCGYNDETDTDDSESLLHDGN